MIKNGTIPSKVQKILKIFLASSTILSVFVLNYSIAFASGGTVSYSGGDTIETFTSSGTFTAPAGVSSVSYLVVAGGGGAGFFNNNEGGGGGGAGGFRTGSGFAVSAGSPITVTVGAGGAGGAVTGPSSPGSNGGNSIFSSITSIGGGGGGGTGGYSSGSNGGSGGGAGTPFNNDPDAPGGTGTAGQGSNGGAASNIDNSPAPGNGGGASGAGGSYCSPTDGPGTASSITGASVTYSTGGDGCYNAFGAAGGANTGNGGNAYGNYLQAGGAGGSGVVIVRYTPDTTPPTTPGIMTTSWGGDHYVNGNFTAATSGSTDSQSGVAYYNLCRSNDNAGGCSVWVATGIGASTVVSGTNLPSDGAYRYYYWYAYDGAGNQSAASTGEYIRMDATAPTHDAISVSSNNWMTNNSATYNITLQSTEAGVGIGGSFGMMALINYQGENSANNRGYFAWHPSSYVHGGNQMACTGGGYASQQNITYGWGYINLTGCSTSVVGNQRTVVLTVRPNTNFGDFADNDISFYTTDALNNARGWTNFDTNFRSDGTAPAFSSKTTYSGWYTTNQTSTFTYADSGSGIASGNNPTCTISTEGSVQTCTLSAAANVVDVAGNVLNPNGTVSNGANIDKTAPTTTGAVTAGTAGAAGWYTSDVTYTLTLVDATSGVASTVYCVDTANTCTPVTSYTVPLTISTESATNYVRWRSTDIAGNVQAIQSSGIIKIDKTAPASATLVSGSAGTGNTTLNWTTSAGETSTSTVLRWATASAGAEAPATSTTYAAGATIGTATVVCNIAAQTTATALSKIDGTGGSAGCTTAALTGGQSYTYKVFQQDTSGNYDVGTTIGTFTQKFDTLADGTNPGNSTIVPGSAITDLDSFTLQTSSGTDSITALTVTLAAGTYVGLSEVRITSNDGSTLYFAAVAPIGDTVSFSGGTPLPVTSSAATFKVRITPKSHAAMPVPPGGTYVVTGTVTSLTGANGQIGSDAGSGTITIDNLSPAGATLASGSAGTGNNNLNWTTTAGETSTSTVLRWAAASAGSDVPAEGATYAAGATIGTATVACNIAAQTTATALSKIDGTVGSVGCTTAALTGGQAYTYKVFQQDTNGNYDVGVAIGTFSPLGALGISSLSNSTLIFNDASTLASQITVTDGGVPVVKAATDLRIAIATSSINVLWDTSKTTLTFGGTAASKVSNPVSYEGGGSVLLIPVNVDFSANDTLTLSGASFTSIGTVTSSAVLALMLFKDGPNDQIADATDGKTVSIKGSLSAAEHPAGQVSNSFRSTASTVSGTVLYAFRLPTSGEQSNVTNLQFTLGSVEGISSGDITNAGLFIDYNDNKIVDAGDTQVGGAGAVSIAGEAGTITFSSAFIATTTRDYILEANISNVDFGNGFSISLVPSHITATGLTSALSTGPTSVSALSTVQHTKSPLGGSRISDVEPTVQTAVGGGIIKAGDSIGNDPNFFPPTTSGGTFNQWTSPNNAFESDNAYATAATSWLREDYGGFNLSVPSSNTISGIEVKLELSGSTAAGAVSAALSWDGGTSTTTVKTSPTLTTPDAVITLGSSSDTWGRTWSPANFSNANFKVRLVAVPSGNTVKVDAIQINVHNAAGGGSQGGGGAIILGPQSRYLASVYEAFQSILTAVRSFFSP